MPKLPAIHFSDSFPADAEKMISAVRVQGLEGIVAKRPDSMYEPGRRNGAWLKMRIGGGQEFVIGGYTPSPKNLSLLSELSSWMVGKPEVMARSSYWNSFRIPRHTPKIPLPVPF